jgi:hypothetical protein
MSSIRMLRDAQSKAVKIIQDAALMGEPTLSHDELSNVDDAVRLFGDAIEILEAGGVKDVRPDDPGYTFGDGIHEMGTARMGRDPRTSVLNGHNQVWDGSIAYGSLVEATHKLGLAVIDAAVLRAKKMIGDLKSGNSAKMVPCSADGGKHFLFMTGPKGMYDLRREVGDAGFLTLEKAAMGAEGKKGVIFTGGKFFYNGVLGDEMQNIVKFNNAGAGTIRAMRSLFLGAHAVAVAYGTKGQNNGSRYELTESDLDHGEEEVIVIRLIAGYKKCRYNSLDHGVIAVDHTYSIASGYTI